MIKSELLQILKQKKFPKKVLDVFAKVKRENFVPEELKSQAYEDTALPIGKGQTISQPYTIALMLSELNVWKNQKVLELGSGCGYVLSLLSELVGEKGKVFGLEIIKELAEQSKENLASQDYDNVQVYNKSGFHGFSDEAPFDRILISAAVREVSEEILSQLKENGILVFPKGSRFEQKIVVLQRQGNTFVVKKEIPGFIFVPFVEGERNVF